MSGAQRLAILAAVLAAPLFFALTRETPISQAAARSDDAQRSAQGQELFDTLCGICHEAGGTGAIMLSRRLGKDRSILATRTDLDSDYVHRIVRAGIGSMPPFSRIEVTDSELDSIAAYLTRPASDRTPSADPAPAKFRSGRVHE